MQLLCILARLRRDSVFLYILYRSSFSSAYDIWCQKSEPAKHPRHRIDCCGFFSASEFQFLLSFRLPESDTVILLFYFSDILFQCMQCIILLVTRLDTSFNLIKKKKWSTACI